MYFNQLLGASALESWTKKIFFYGQPPEAESTEGRMKQLYGDLTVEAGQNIVFVFFGTFFLFAAENDKNEGK